MASTDTGLLVFSDDVTEDRSSRKNPEVHRDILSAQIQSNGAKLIRRRFIVQMDDDPKHTARATQEYSAMSKSISWSQPDSLAEDKTKAERLTNKQLKSAIPDLRQSFPAKDSQQNIKN